VSENSFMRRFLRRQDEEPADPVAVERDVYEKLYGEPSSDISVSELPAQPTAHAGRPARTRQAPKRAAASRAVS
jgi:hypothetical protein